MTDQGHLLIVDDQPFNLTLIQRELERFDIGCRFSTAINGLDALALVATDPPDLIILDIMMPEMNGFETCQRLKSDPATADIPIILLTALTDARSRIKGIEVGADDFISKPFNPHELLARVRSLLRLRQARRQLREEHQRLNAVLQSTCDAIVVSDSEGCPSLLNSAAEQLLGVRGVDVYGRPWREFVEDPALLSFLERAPDLVLPHSLEITTADGQVFHASVSPLTTMGTVTVLHDITLDKELEQMRLEAARMEQQRLRQAFERYMSPELVERVLNHERGLLEQHDRMEAVVMFADLRGFTRLTTHLPPDTVVHILNGFFTEMTHLIHSNQGTIFDLIGDELMIGYGVPFPQADAADRALQTAVAMQRRFSEMAQIWQAQHGVVVGLGVGINRGMVIVGNVGSPRRMHYAMVGEIVNIAHRLVKLARPGEIVLAQSVLDGLAASAEALPVEPLPPLAIEGKEGLHAFYRIKI